ncbi:MAG: ABC transporter permease [bacterium]|nr:ABC transporter permease [bacterium]
MKSKPGNLQLRLGMGLMAAVLLLMVSFALFRHLSIGIDMSQRLAPASASYVLGTDEMGRDLLSCLVYGAGVSLVIAVTVVFISVVLGGVLGLVSGFAGGVTDTIIMRLVDVLMAFPGILLAIALAAFFSHGPVTLILVLTVTGWVEYARLIRGEVLKYKQNQFILAARSYNASFGRILFHHLLPLVLPLTLVQASLGISGVILVESGLNFLGIGLDPLLPTLGQLVDAGRDHLFDHPMLVIAPGLVLFVLIIAFNFIGEGLRKKFTR